MKRVFKRKMVSLLCICAVLLGVLPGMPGLVVDASATVSGDQTTLTGMGISLSDSGGTWVVDGNSISGSVTGTAGTSGCGGTPAAAAEGKLTITNNSGETRILKFTFSSTASGGTVQVDGDSNAVSPFSKELAAGSSIDVYIKSAANASTTSVSLTGISLNTVGKTVSAEFLAVPGLSYTAGGQTISADTQFESIDAASGIAVSAPATYTAEVDGETVTYMFFAWKNLAGETESVVMGGTAHETTLSPEGGEKIKPVYITQRTAPFAVGSTPYYTWEDAFTAAGATGTVVQVANCELPTTLAENGLSKNGKWVTYDSKTGKITYSMPEGATFLVPYSDSNYTIAGSTYTDESGNLKSTWIYANNGWTSDNYDNSTVDDMSVENIMEPNESVFRTLTIPSSAIVNVNSGGKFVIGGTIVGGSKNTGGIQGGTAGPHGNITVNGTLNVNSGGIMSTCGYVLGGGSVNVVSGGSLYQPFTMTDYRDGHYTVNCKENGTFPSNRYIMNNVQCPLTISYGGKMFGYMDIYTQTTAYIFKLRHNVTVQQIVGTESDTAMIQLKSGSSMTSTYDATDYVTVSDSGRNTRGFYSKVGKMTVTITGGAALGEMELTVTLAGTTYTVNSNTTDFPVPYYYDFILKNGTYNLANNLALLPGASMWVDSTATLVVDKGAEFTVFDGLRDYSSTGTSVSAGSWMEYHYPSTSELKNNHSKKTYTGTANLIVDGAFTVNGSFGGYVQTNGSGTITMNGTASATAGVGNVVAYGGVVNKNAGRTERTLDAWLYKTDGRLITMATGGTYKGTDKNAHTIANYDYRLYTAADNTSTYTDVKDEVLNASIIGSWACVTHVSVVDAAVAATCTTTGLTQGSHCSVCDEVLIAQQEIAKKDHTPGSAATCEADQCCTVCGYVIVSASGVHDPAVQGSLCFHKAMIGDAPYETLAAAVDAYSTGYIKMIDDSTETNCVIDGEVYLDLAGKNVTGSVSIGDGGVLYGFDTTTDGYDKRGGSITLTSEPEAVTESPITEGWVYAAYTADSGDGAKTYTFNRTSVYVSDYYMEIIADGTAKVGFAGVFRGNADAALALQDLGFEVNETEIRNGARPDGVQDKFRFSYTGTATGYGNYAVEGLMEFGGTTLTSQNALSFNFTNVLKSYYGSTKDEKAKAVIELFAGKNDITL